MLLFKQKMSSFKQQVFFVFYTCASVLLILEVGLATANVEHRESESVIGITKLPEEVTIEDNSTITSEFPSNLNNTTFPATSNQSTADEVSFTPNITSTETDGFGNSSKLTTVVGNNTNVNVTTFAPTSYNVSLSTVSAVMSNVTGNATATYNATTINVENDTEAGKYTFLFVVSSKLCHPQGHCSSIRSCC